MSFLKNAFQSLKRGFNETFSHTATSRRPDTAVRHAQTTERQRQVEVPDLTELSAEDFESLRRHPFFKDFEEGMWEYYKANIGDGKTQARQKADFENLCKTDVRQHLEYLLGNGELGDFKQFLERNRSRATPATARPAARSAASEARPARGAAATTMAETPPARPTVSSQAGAEPRPEPETASPRITVSRQASAGSRRAEIILPAEEAEAEQAEAKDWKEVKRDTEVMAVGDLHGSMTAFKENLKTLGVVNEKSDGSLEWVGGSSRLIFLGDILADRNTQGHDIILAMEDLKKQAKAGGGEIHVFAGNHDDFELSFLMGRKAAGGGDAVKSCYAEDQGKGLLELIDFGSDQLKSRDFKAKPYEFSVESPPNSGSYQHDAIWDQISTERDLILTNMRNSVEGRKLLEAFCQLEVVNKIDDSLFFHTMPNGKMIQYFLDASENPDDAVSKINSFFQQTLRAVLIDGRQPNADFDRFRDMFLRTSNRVNFDDAEKYGHDMMEDKYSKKKLTDMPQKEYDAEREAFSNSYKPIIAERTAKLKVRGINAIFHGHDDPHEYGVMDPKKIVKNPAFPIVSVDLSAFKGGGNQSPTRSVLKISKDGSVGRGTVLKAGNRGLVPQLDKMVMIREP